MPDDPDTRTTRQLVDSSRIASELDVRATPTDQALAGTLTTYRDG